MSLWAGIVRSGVLLAAAALSPAVIAAGFIDAMNGPALDPRWVPLLADGGRVTMVEGTAQCSSPLAASACALRLDGTLDKGTSGVWVFAFSNHSGAEPQTWLTLVDRASPPTPGTSAAWDGATRVRVGMATVAGTPGLVFEHLTTAHASRWWSSASAVWTATIAPAITPVQPDDYYLVGLELDATRQAFRLMAWCRRSPDGNYTFDQGLRLFTLTEWVAWTSVESSDDLYLVVGDPLTDAGAGTLRIDRVRHDAGPKRHLWSNSRPHGDRYVIRHAWGYESVHGGVEVALQQDRSGFTLDVGASGAWDDAGFGVKDPSVLFDPVGDEYVLAYQSGNAAIGLAIATSPDGPFVKWGGNPVIAGPPPGNGYVFAPALLEDGLEPDPDRRFKLLYGTADDNPPLHWRVYWSSAPAVRGPWTDRGLLLDVGTPGAFDQNGFTRPRAVYREGRWTVLLSAKTVDEPGKPFRVTWAEGPTLDALTPSGQILVDRGAGPTAEILAPIAGRLVQVSDSSGFTPGAFVEVDDDPDPDRWAGSRIRRILDPGTLELSHGLDGVGGASPARIVQIDAANRIEVADIAYANGRFWLYVTPFQLMGAFAPDIVAFDENTGLLTSDSLTGPYAWNHDASPVLTRGSWNNEASNENLAFVRLPVVDGDGDGFEASYECDDAAAEAWDPPGEATQLGVGADKQTWSFAAPSRPGGTTVVYDLLRSSRPDDFSAAAATCAASGSATPTGTDAALPASGAAFHYLARAVNGCGGGTLGDGLKPRSARPCS